MASPCNFTLDDSEEADTTTVPVSSVAPVAQAPAQLSRAAERPISPTPSVGSPTILTTNVRDPPKLHVDTDLGVSDLAQAAAALQENQKRIGETETLLQGLMRHHARLVAAGRLLEQQKVLDVVATGPELGYDTGRPIAALLAYRCCLRWGCFSGDAQAAAVLDNLSALLLSATDEDAIAGRAAVAVRAQAGGSAAGGVTTGSQGGAQGVGLLHDEGSLEETVAVAAATREVAYWLAVTSILLALVDPHLPLTGMGRPAAGSSDHSAAAAPTPLAAVAGDARASMARAASAAAAKVQELQKRMGNTLSGMQLLGKNLLMRRRGSAANRTTAGGTEGGDSGHAHEQEQQQQRQSSGAIDETHGEAAEVSASVPAGNVSGPARSPSPSTGAAGPELHLPASMPLPAAPSPPPAGPAQGATAGQLPHSPQAFRQQLDLIVQKTYVQMRDSLKRHVSAVLPGCVQQPMAIFSPREGLSSGGGAASSEAVAAEAAAEDASGVSAGRTTGGSAGGAGGVGASPSLQSWMELIGVLSQHLALLREAHVPRILIRCLFKQTLAFVDVQLFNQLLLRPECCCTSNARYLVAGLQLLDAWLAGTGPGPSASPSAGETESGTGTEAGAGGSEGTGAGHPHGSGAASLGRMSLPDQGPGLVLAGEDLAVLADNLRHIRQASHFLILANKGALKLDDFTAMCPALNVQQLYRLATTFWDDSPMPPPPPPAPAAPQSPPRASSHLEAATGGGEPEAPASPAAADDAEEVAHQKATEKEGDRMEGTDAAEPPADQAEGQGAGAEGLEAAAAAAVAAAEAAAAADEAGETAEEPQQQLAPLPSPEAAAAASAAAAAVSRNVSGEVLEEMKRRHSVANNGGLIVTFLLDEDSAPLIVQGSGSPGAVARQLLQIINEPKLHEGLHGGLPPALCGPDCPPQAFGFMLDGVAP